MSTFDFKSGCEANQPKEATINVLTKEDLDSEEALKLLTSNDSDNLGLSMSQKRIFEAAVRKLKQTGAKETTSDECTPVTTKTLANYARAPQKGEAVSDHFRHCRLLEIR